MAIEIKEEKAQENKPLLNIKLPTPISANPNAPLSVGQHNASAKNNFQEVANVLLKIINNQKMLGMVISEQEKKITNITKLTNSVNENIRKLLKENDNVRTNTNNTKSD